MRKDDGIFTTGALVCLGALQSDPTTTASSRLNSASVLVNYVSAVDIEVETMT